MNIDTAISGMMQAREALQEAESLSSPTYISDNMYRLAQYVSAVEEGLGTLEEDLEVKESVFFNEMTDAGNSVNATQVSMKYEFAKDRAYINKITRLVSSSWKLISASQSRIKNLVEESNLQRGNPLVFCA